MATPEVLTAPRPAPERGKRLLCKYLLTGALKSTQQGAGYASLSPRHPAIVQTFFSSEFHHQSLFQVFWSHLHYLAIRLLHIKITVSGRRANLIFKVIKR